MLQQEYVATDTRALFSRNRFEDTIRSTESYEPFTQIINECFPHRFDDSLPGIRRDDPTAYITSFVEASVRGPAADGSGYATDDGTVSSYVDELIAVLAASDTELAICQVVGHITTTTGCPVQIGDVVVHPGESDPDKYFWGALPIIESVIPETRSVLSHDQSLIGLAPGSVVQVRTRVARPGIEVMKSSARIADFLLAVRLITGATVCSDVEIRGRTSRIGWIWPYITQFPSQGGIQARTYRTARISQNHAEPIASLLDMLGEATASRSDKFVSSLEVALIMFDRSHQNVPWFDRIVNLATALEATLIDDGDKRAGVSRRLRQRASTLLACDGDSPNAICRDTKKLYELRSTLVHGGNLTSTGPRCRACRGSLEGHRSKVNSGPDQSGPWRESILALHKPHSDR